MTQLTPIDFIFWLMLGSWVFGALAMIVGAFDEMGIAVALITWLMFSLPLTTLWALIWVILEVFG